MASLKMPERKPTDGPFSVNRRAGQMIEILVTQNGEERTILMSEFNAWRVFGAMAILLGIKLSDAAAKAIRF